MESEEVSIKEVLENLKRRWKMIAIIVLVCLIVASVYSFFITKPVYKISTKLFIGKEVSDGASDYNSSEVQMYQKLMKTYAGIAKSDDVIQRALDRGDSNASAKSILSNLEVIAGNDDQFLTISLSTKEPGEGLKVLNNIIDEFIETSSKIYANGNVSIVTTPKYPESAISPNKKLTIAIAFMIGVMCSVGLALLLEFMDNTAKSKEEIEEILGVSVLGILPEYTDEDKLDDFKSKRILGNKHLRNKKRRRKNKGEEYSRESYNDICGSV